MKHADYRELLSLADALNFISESELLWSLVKADGDSIPDVNFSEVLKYLVTKVASEIYSNLTA